MRYVIDPLLGIFLVIFSLLTRWWFALIAAAVCYWQTGSQLSELLLAPAIGFIFAWLSIKWDAVETPGGDGGVLSTTIRGDMQFLRSVYQTPDERMPGDITQPAVGRWLAYKGKMYCSFLWAGERNVAMGLARLLGHEAQDYLPETGSWVSREDAWRWQVTLGGFRFSVGNQVVKALDGKFYAYPQLTLKRFSL